MCSGVVILIQFLKNYDSSMWHKVFLLSVTHPCIWWWTPFLVHVLIQNEQGSWNNCVPWLHTSQATRFKHARLHTVNVPTPSAVAFLEFKWLCYKNVSNPSGALKVWMRARLTMCSPSTVSFLNFKHVLALVLKIHNLVRMARFLQILREKNPN